MRYPLIVALPASTSFDEIEDRLDDAMSPYYEYRDKNYVDENGLQLANGKWDRYELGAHYSGFFPVNPGASASDLIASQNTKEGTYCDGGRIRALNLEGKRAAAARSVAGTRPKDTANEADRHWDDIVTWARDNALPTGAVLTHTGEWMSPDNVRFVFKPATHSPEHAAFLINANDYLDSLSEDTILVIVDCHT